MCDPLSNHSLADNSFVSGITILGNNSLCLARTEERGSLMTIKKWWDVIYNNPYSAMKRINSKLLPDRHTKFNNNNVHFKVLWRLIDLNSLFGIKVVNKLNCITYESHLLSNQLTTQITISPRITSLTAPWTLIFNLRFYLKLPY